MTLPGEGPRRPCVPPAAWFACAMWLGCALGEEVSWRLYAANSVWWLGASAAVVIALGTVIACRHRGPRAVIALGLAGLIAGCGASGMQGVQWHAQSATTADCGARSWTGRVEADPMPGRFGSTVRVRVRGGPLDGARVRVNWPSEVPVPDLGRTVRFSAVLSPPPAGEVWSRRVARTGACATGSAWSAEVGGWGDGPSAPLFRWRATVLERMHGIPGPGGDLLEGIVLGDRRRLIDTPADEDFRVLGLTHLVAVSGSHLALACGAVAIVGGMLGVRRRPLLVAMLLAGAAYAAVTGMAYSALRSLMMLGVAAVGQLSGRRGDGLGSLSAGTVAVLVVEPWSVHDIGFQLSVLAVGSLLLFGGLATAWAEAGVCRALRPLAGPVSLTFVAQAVTVPVIASCFGMVSLLAPVANGYAGPLVSLALWTGLSGAVVVQMVPWLGMLLLRFTAAVLEGTAWISGLMAQTPGAAIAVGSSTLMVLGPVVAAVVVWVWWPVPGDARSARAVVAAVIGLSVAMAFGPVQARSAALTVLDVGQGDAILVRDGGRTMLVDTGADDVSLRRALARHGIRRIDALVFTHAHDDHTGGAAGLAQVAEIGWTGFPAVDAVSFGWVDGPRPLKTGDHWRLGGITVTVLWPPGQVAGEPLDTNDTSVVLHVACGGFDAVLGGDAEKDALTGAAEGVGLPHVEVLKVPHHGSDNGLTREALDDMAPRDALISVGAGNDFGHPCESTLEMLDGAGCRVWRTDEQGDITVRIGREGYSIRSARRGSRTSLRERMDAPRRVLGDAPHADLTPEAMHGSQRTRGPQAGLPHLRGGRPAARARPPPFARSHSRGG